MAERILPHNDFDHSPMGKPLYFSIGFHVLIFVFATIGFPFLVKDLTPPEDIVMNVDFMEVAEETASPEPNEPAPEPEKEAEPEPTPPSKPEPVYNSSDSVPELSSITPPKKDVQKPEAVPDPTEIVTPPKPLLKPKPPKKPEPKPEPTPQKVEPAKQPQKDITSLLKSLTPEKSDETTQETSEVEDSKPQPAAAPNFSKQLSMSELAALNAGVQPCWNVNAGGKYAEELIVSLRVYLNQDMSVRRVDIIDNGMSFDTHKRAAAEAARRALLNPKCNKLRLPPEKYEYWKEFVYTFDPSDML